MKIQYLVFSASIFVLLFSCSKNETQDLTPGTDDGSESEQPEELTGMVNYFTANIGLEKNTELFDDYLIIHDSNGKLIDFKPFEMGESIKFSAHNDSITDNFTVTYLFTRTETQYPVFWLHSFPNIQKGSTRDFNNNYVDGNLDSNQFQKTGYFSINITGDSEMPESIFISNGGKAGVNTNATPIAYNSQEWGSRVHLDMEANKNDFFITTLNSSDFSKYYLLENVVDNVEYTLDYNDFSNFDSYIDFSAPSEGNLFLKLTGYKNNEIPVGDGYTLYSLSNLSSINVSSTESLKLGYLNSFFTGYAFSVSYSVLGYEYTKNYFGPNPPLTLRVPERPEITIINDSIENFKIDINLDYISSSSVWQGGDSPHPTSSTKSTIWQMFAKKDEYPRLGPIPEELYNKYPTLKANEVEHQTTSFLLNFSTTEEYKQESVTEDTYEVPINSERISIYRY